MYDHRVAQLVDTAYVVAAAACANMYGAAIARADDHAVRTRTDGRQRCAMSLDIVWYGVITGCVCQSLYQLQNDQRAAPWEGALCDCPYFGNLCLQIRRSVSLLRNLVVVAT